MSTSCYIRLCLFLDSIYKQIFVNFLSHMLEIVTHYLTHYTLYILTPRLHCSNVSTVCFRCMKFSLHFSANIESIKVASVVTKVCITDMFTKLLGLCKMLMAAWCDDIYENQRRRALFSCWCFALCLLNPQGQ